MTKMFRYMPISGTHEKRKKSWVNKGSLFDRFMTVFGFTRLADDLRFWSGALAGTFFTSSGHRVWQYGGRQVYSFLEKLTEEERKKLVIVAHSHGGTVLAYALAMRPLLKVGAIVTVGTPVRRDIDDVWQKAKEATDLHIQIYSVGFGSFVRWIGQRGRLRREMPWADKRWSVKGGHSGVLRKRKHMSQFVRVLIHVLEKFRGEER